MSEYQQSFRSNYELWAAGIWSLFIALGWWMGQTSLLPKVFFHWMMAVCGLMALVRARSGLLLYWHKQGLRGRPLEIMTLAQLQQQMKKHPKAWWLGRGFVWQNQHTQKAFEITQQSGVDSTVPTPPSHQDITLGQTWIHGLERQESDQTLPISHAEGHTLILGTTGSGKTRLFELLISQAILRGETVIILDPKGDHGLWQTAQRVCVTQGQPKRFVCFHPAFPEQSVRLDPLRNFTRTTEIASRLAALVPSETGADPFKSFAWQALNNIAQALVMICERPNLVRLRHFLEGSAAGLVVQAIQHYCQRVMPDWQSKAQPFIERQKGRSTEATASALMRFYHQRVQPQFPSPELEGLLSMFQHDHTHFAKMVASLLPVLNMLTSGDLGKLLSPDYQDLSDNRPITDTRKIINNRQVAYIGLDSLTDGVVGSAVGSIILADLTAVAGDRYNYGSDNHPVNIFIDEAAEVVNDPFIQLLNKGRGAGIRLFVATQTVADLSARLNSRDKARQVLGNLNNLIALRVLDSDSQCYVTDNLPQTRIRYVMRAQGQTTQVDEPILHGGNQGERLVEESADLFPAPLLGLLPNLEYIAKISGGRIVKGRLPLLDN